MKTEFGIFVRNIRLQNNENLRQMAEKLEVSSAFLSAVEVGKKTAPKDWVGKIASLYKLNKEEENRLQNCIDKDNGKVIININNMNEDRQNISMMFARTINTASQKTLEELKEMLSKCK